jgi:hypothetical protein
MISILQWSDTISSTATRRHPSDWTHSTRNLSESHVSAITSRPSKQEQLNYSTPSEIKTFKLIRLSTGSSSFRKNTAHFCLSFR